MLAFAFFHAVRTLLSYRAVLCVDVINIIYIHIPTQGVNSLKINFRIN